MTTQRGWHRATIEWSDGIVTTGHRLECVAGEDDDVFREIASTLAIVMEGAGLSGLVVTAEILASLDTTEDDPCAEALVEAAARFVRRRRGGRGKGRAP